MDINDKDDDTKNSNDHLGEDVFAVVAVKITTSRVFPVHGFLGIIYIRIMLNLIVDLFPKPKLHRLLWKFYRNSTQGGLEYVLQVLLDTEPTLLFPF